MNKYVVGAAGLALLLLAVWGYGRYEHSQGYDLRNTEAKLELAAQQAALHAEQMRLEDAVTLADQEVQTLKEQTAIRTASLDADLNRLRRKLAASSQHAATRATSGANGADPDWIGIIGACWGDYAELGKESAVYADRVNGLQRYIRAVRP